MVSQKTQRRIKQAGVALFLLTSVSAYALMSRYVCKQTKDFDKKNVVIEKDTISLQNFYENVKHDDKTWSLELKDGRVANIDSLTDFRLIDSVRYRYDTDVKIKRVVDTVDVRLSDSLDSKGRKSLVFSMDGKDDLGYVPSMGSYLQGVLKLRYFRANSDDLQNLVDRRYNDTINRTSEHELHHYHNVIAGIRLSGQSYEVKFCECGFDEISANIKQLLAQRNSYIENGGDDNLITKRFSFYSNAVKKGMFKPDKNKKMSQEEIDFIANGMFDTWMKEKYPLYIEKNANRAVNILQYTNYNGIQPNQQRHVELMKKMFFIDGMDFYPAISKRESEMREAIPDHVKKRFLALKKLKYRKMNELDKLEKIRLEEGKKEYDKTMRWNKMLAQVRNYCIGY